MNKYRNIFKNPLQFSTTTIPTYKHINFVDNFKTNATFSQTLQNSKISKCLIAFYKKYAKLSNQDK